MNVSAKDRLAQAISMPGFQHWRSPVDVPSLHRPPVRPETMPGQGRIGAVLVLLYPSEEIDPGSSCHPNDGLGLNVVLTKRNKGLSNHAGQISFPGGRNEAGESLWQTACREAFEEIGVGKPDSNSRSQEIELIGQLKPIYIPPSDFTVSPFVGWQDRKPEFVCAPEEVEAVFETSLLHLLNPETLKVGEVTNADSKTINVPFYEVDEHRIWGATAIMLSELIERIRRLPN